MLATDWLIGKHVSFKNKKSRHCLSIYWSKEPFTKFLVPGTEDRTWVYGGTNCTDPFADDQQPCLATSQNVIQKFLLFVAVICIPVMLFAKPYMKYKAWQEKQNRGTTNFGGVRVQVIFFIQGKSRPTKIALSSILKSHRCKFKKSEKENCNKIRKFRKWKKKHKWNIATSIRNPENIKIYFKNKSEIFEKHMHLLVLLHLYFIFDFWLGIR